VSLSEWKGLTDCLAGGCGLIWFLVEGKDLIPKAQSLRQTKLSYSTSSKSAYGSLNASWAIVFFFL